MTALKRPVICLPAIEWGFLFHRPQQVALQLSKAGHPVYFRNPNQVPGTPPEEVAPHLWVYKDFAMVPDYVLNGAIYIVYLPWYTPLIPPGDDKYVVYDCIDDDPKFPPFEDVMLNRSDLVICVSKPLMEKLQAKHPQVMFLPNGVDLQHYLPKRELPPPEMMQIVESGDAVIGFTGAFYDGWVDINLFYELARVRPNWRFVIVGHTYDWDFRNAPPNIISLGKKPYQDVPSYTHCFDVGMIPFIDNQIARGADPVKLYEYLAAGLPVISSNLPFAEHLNPPLVYKYHSLEGCLAMLEQALADNRAYGEKARQQRLDYASQFSWDQQGKKLIKMFAEHTWLEGLR